jgi:hypothetical protein
VDRNHPSRNKHSLIRLQEWFLPDETIFAKVKFHGNTSWSPSALVWLAIWWAWLESRHLTDAFAGAVKATRQISPFSSLTTYQGFMKALVRWSPTFIDLISLVLQERMKEIGGRFWRIHGWVPIAFDGSRNSAARTKKNEKAFCAPNYGKGKTARYRKKKTKGMRRRKNQKNKPQPQKPQTWITLMWHMGLRLPWTWRLGPSNSSERAHVIDMVESGKFPKNTLFCGDAGFVGYPLWSTILRHHGHFLVRVGANVDLLMETAEYRLVKNGVVLFWPKTLMQANRLPIRLRLVQVPLGNTQAWMLTSVLNPRDLTPQQILRFYKLRWGVEVEFRGLKQTLDRAKLRCHNPQRLLAELDWSIMAMAIAELFALKEQLSSRHHNRVYVPSKRSLAATMRILRDCLRNLDEVPAAGFDLSSRLWAAVTDGYQRKASKKARYHPPNPDKKKIGDPNLRQLRPTEQKKLRRLEGKIAT